MIAAVIPCFKVRDQILGVLARIGPEVQKIYVVDDGSPDQLGAFLRERCQDPRVQLLTHATNQGVGAAVVTGMKQALQDGCEIVVKVDGDGQIDPQEIPRLLKSLYKADADYAKGNRFYDVEYLKGMPVFRLLGNAVLSFLTKFSTGYWTKMDPTNGFIAIRAGTLRQLPLHKLSRDYFFETDMLFRLHLLRAFVVDVPLPARYGAEQSNMNLAKIVLTFPWKHARCFFKRVFYEYCLRDFSVASVEIVVGPLLFLTGLVSLERVGLVSMIPALIGFQMILSAIHFDIHNEPKTRVSE